MNLSQIIKSIGYRLGISGRGNVFTEVSEMQVPPGWGYQSYLQAYGQIGWLFACVNVIASAVAKTNWHLYDVSGDGERTEIFIHPLIDLLNNVNPFYTRYQFFYLGTMYKLLVGEEFWQINFNQGGLPGEMWLAPPAYMSVVPSAQNYIDHYEYKRGAMASPLIFTNDEIIHIMTPNPYNPYRGLSPAQALTTDLDSERYAARYQQKLFFNDATPGFVVKYPAADMPPMEVRKELMQEWDERFKGFRNRGKTAFLWGGEPMKITMTNTDMDFNALRHFSRDVILGAYRVPGIVVGMSDANRANAEAGQYQFAMYAVDPELAALREAMNKELVVFFGDNLYLDYENPIPEDETRKVNNSVNLFKAKLITRNEARADTGYEELTTPDGEEFFTDPVQQNPFGAPGQPGNNPAGNSPVIPEDQNPEAPAETGKSFDMAQDESAIPKVTKYSDDQPRDEDGKWTDGGGSDGHQINHDSLDIQTSPTDYSLNKTDSAVKDKISTGYKTGQDMAVKYNGDMTSAIYSENLTPIFDDTDTAEGFTRGFKGEEIPPTVIGWRYGEAPASGISNNFRDNSPEHGVSMMAAKLEDGSLYKTGDRVAQVFIRDRETHIYRGFLYGVGADGEPTVRVTTHIGVGNNYADPLQAGKSHARKLFDNDLQREEYWKSYVKRVEAYEAPIIKSMTAIFEAQKQEALEAMKRPVSPGADLINKQEFIKKYEAAVTPVLSALMSESIKQGMELVAPKNPHKDNPPIPPVVNARSLDWLATRIGWAALEIGEETAKLLGQALTDGFAAGESMEDIAKRVMSVFDVSPMRAMNIARTETISASNFGAVEGYRETGIVHKTEWYTARDERVCPICDTLHGQINDINEGFIPPAHPSCRCCVLPVIE